MLSKAFVGSMLIATVLGAQPYPPNFRGQISPYGPDQIAPQSTPPPASPVQAGSARVALFKAFVIQAAQAPYRRLDGQIFSIAPLAEFLLQVADMPATEESRQELNQVVRPLPTWSILYGKVGQITDRNGVLLWKYEKPDMSGTPQLVRIEHYPLEKTLVDGAVLCVFARNESPYSYLTTERAKATVASYDFGQVVSLPEVQAFIQQQSHAPKNRKLRTSTSTSTNQASLK